MIKLLYIEGHMPFKVGGQIAPIKKNSVNIAPIEKSSTSRGMVPFGKRSISTKELFNIFFFRLTNSFAQK